MINLCFDVPQERGIHVYESRRPLTQELAAALRESVELDLPIFVHCDSLSYCLKCLNWALDREIPVRGQYPTRIR